MQKKHVPIWGAFRWGFLELSGHLATLIPLSAVFFAPELSEKAGYAWPLLIKEIFKTAFFFMLLLRAMKLTKPKDHKAPQGTPKAFAQGELIKMLAQGAAFLLGAALLGAWMMFHSPAFLSQLWLGEWDLAGLAQRGAEIKAWWLAEPFWAEVLEVVLLGWLPLRVHVLLNFFGYIVADQGWEAKPALRESMRLGQGVQTGLWVFYALCVILNIIGFWLYIVGAIFTFPATVLATVYVYRALAQWSEHG